jgi:glycosyltransferase involved in cell wall biosynthesis
MGVAVEIICLQRQGPLGREAAAAGVPVVCLNSLRGYDVRAALALAREFRRFRPDVVNVHDRSSLPYVVLADRLSGRRAVVLSAHGLLLEDRARRRLRDRLSARGLTAVTAVSDAVAREYRDVLDWPDAIAVIPNGTAAIERYSGDRPATRRDLGIAPEAFIFLAVGNVKPEKGFEDLLAAAARLRQARAADDTPFLVLIAGGTADDACRQRLGAMQADLGLERTVRFLGYRQDTPGLYSAADAFVLSSRTEGLPMVLLEAMSAGLPIVATRVGGVPDAVSGEAGLLVDAARPDQLAQAMLRLLEDRRLRERLGERAMQRARREYSIEAMAARYLDVYDRARDQLGGPPARRSRRRVPRRPTVLMLGPAPPQTGGMATAIGNLLGSRLAGRARLLVLNTGKTTRHGRTLTEGVLAQLRLLLRLVSALRRDRVEIVHIHTCEFTAFWRDCVHAAAAGCLGCHVVWHIHGATFDRWAAGLDAARRALVRLALERASAVIVLSEEWRRRLLTFGPRAHWRVIENGVPMPRACTPPPPGPPCFLFLGDWTPRKGVLDLVGATALAAKYQGFRGTVNLAGFEKQPGQRQTLDRAIADSGCRGQINVLGLVSGDRKREALEACHCVVLPSYGEGLPIAILEAMGHARAVIVTKVGAIPGLITHGHEGLLIDPGDVEALAAAIARFDADPSLAERMGRAARRRVEKRYSLDAMADKTADVYRRVMAGGRRPPGREAP